MKMLKTKSVAVTLPFLALWLLGASQACAGPVIFLPTGDNDAELTKLADGLAKQIHASVVKAGEKKLGTLADADRLFIIVHGHEKLPLFCASAGAKEVNGKRQSWSAKEMADLVEKEGLKKTHKDIFLLVCFGGLSIGDQATVAKLMKTRQEWEKAKKKGDTTTSTKKEDEYKALAETIKPTAYTGSKDEELPISAKFAGALKDARYTKFRVISYNGPILQANLEYFGRVVLGDQTKSDAMVEDLTKGASWKAEDELKLLYGDGKDGKIYRSIWR